MRRSRTILILILAGVALMVAPAQPVAADHPAPLALTIAAGWDGYRGLTPWIPVRVTVDNPGEVVRGSLHVEVSVGSAWPPSDRQDLPVTLPARQTSVFHLYARS